jgi:hypothetical protein
MRRPGPWLAFSGHGEASLQAPRTYPSAGPGPLSATPQQAASSCRNAHAAASATLEAASEGANFRELGDAWGITRQGALKKWGRLVEECAAPDAGDRVRLISEVR